MTIWISREHPLFNFKLLGTSRASIVHPCQKLWPSELDQSFLVRFRASRYIVSESDIRVKSYDNFNFSRTSIIQFRASLYIMGLNHTLMSKVMAVWIGPELSCLISSVSIYYVPESDIRGKSYDHLNFSRIPFSILCISIYYVPESDIQVKSYDHLNFSRTSIFQFRASRYIMGLNRTPMSKVMAIWIGPKLLCSISSVSRYYVPESDIRVKSYDHFNFSRTSIFQFRASWNIMGLNRTSM